MYKKFILLQIKILLLLILSAVLVYPFFVYPFRKRVWRKRNDTKKGILYWFADTDEKGSKSDYENYVNSFYGLYELLKDENGNPDFPRYEKMTWLGKFFLSYHWGVWRNGMWNYIIANAPKQGKKTNINKYINEGDGGYFGWRNKSDWGKQFVTFDIDNDGKRQFRYSFTKEARPLNLYRILIFILNLFIFRIRWAKYFNFMVGMEHRYIFKMRLFSK